MYPSFYYPFHYFLHPHFFSPMHPQIFPLLYIHFFKSQKDIFTIFSQSLIFQPHKLSNPNPHPFFYPLIPMPIYFIYAGKA